MASRKPTHLYAMAMHVLTLQTPGNGLVSVTRDAIHIPERKALPPGSMAPVDWNTPCAWYWRERVEKSGSIRTGYPLLTKLARSRPLRRRLTDCFN